MKIKILIPIYNDWQSVDKLINEIDNLVKEINHEFSIVIVNDGSSEMKPDRFGFSENLHSVQILNIKKNTFRRNICCFFYFSQRCAT